MNPQITWKPVSEEENIKRRKIWGENSSARDPVVSAPYNVVMSRFYPDISDKIYNFDVRPDDVWIITYPKCGTTWTQEIVWHIMNDVNKELSQTPLLARSPFLEFEGIHAKGLFDPMLPPDPKEAEKRRRVFDESIDLAASLPSPRVIKSHMALEFLPPNLLDTAKVIYVCRNPKDACVSYFHHMTDAFPMLYEYNGTFDQYVELFMQGQLDYGNYFDHLKRAWKHRNHPNMKFVWYENMLKDSIKEVTEMAKFVNHPLSEEKIVELVEHVKFSNMKERGNGVYPKDFFRKGVVGDWKNYFKGEKLKEWDEWIANNLEESDIILNFG